MTKTRATIRLLSTALLLLTLAGPAGAWQLLLDIDDDGDPTTITTTTPDSSAEVALVLWPDYTGERVIDLDCGLGGSCRDCGQTAVYGVDPKLIPDGDGNWVQTPEFSGTLEHRFTVGCTADLDYDLLLHAEPTNGNVFLEEPLVLARFWVEAPAQPSCDQPHFTPPPADLGAFDLDSGDPWNMITLRSPQTAATAARWSAIKSLYR